jgi:hypothetical protein
VLLACTIVMSTFIVVLTLTEGYESFYHKAEVLHDSARQLNRLSFNMSLRDINSPGGEDLILEVAKEYETIIENSLVNHAECDYIRVRARRPELFGFEAPKLPQTSTSKFVWQFKRTADWSQSVAREFLWLSLPLIFSILSSFMIYLMIAYNWPENIAINLGS